MIDELLKNAQKKDVLTKFLSLEEQKQIKGINCLFSNIGEERKRAYLSKNIINDVDFNIDVLEVSYNTKFYELNHSQVLGSLMGLGISRDCIGDIIVSKNIYIIVISEMSTFVINNLNKIDKASINIQKVDANIIETINVDKYVSENIIISSMRLDVIVSSITNLSREKVKEFINLKNVKVNGIITTSIDYITKTDDLISIRKFGRTVIKEIVKKTKKDRIVLHVLRTK